MVRHRIIIAICLFIGTVAGAQNTNLGKRYQFIDNEVESVSTRFEKVEVTTSRAADGKVVTRMRGADGKAVGRALVSHAEQPLDAVNADRYLAWRDGRVAVRKERELGRATGDILEVTTRTRTLTAFSRRGLIGGRHEGKELPAFTSVLRTADGKEDLGAMAWFAENQILAFQMKWDAEPYYLTADVLPEGWTFEPNMAWANIQLLSFARSREDIAAAREAKGLVAHDDVGCTGLHWLDGGVLRPCCDIHDQCYYKNGCTYRSWWFQGSWSCVQCNINAVECMTIRRYLCEYTENCPIIGWRWDYGGNTYDCYIEGAGWCPAYCRACGRIVY